MNDITVQFNDSFATNLLSGALCRQEGYKQGYDSDKDFFWLEVDGNTITYAPQEDDQKLIFTVTEAEEEKAREALELVRKLGYPSLRAVN